MTSINCIRFDEYSGMCLCDEARTWNEEEGRLLTAEKMRLLSSPEVIEGTGSVFVMGKTGTSTLGNEFLETTKDLLTATYRKRCEAEGAPLKRFMTTREVAHFLFDNLITCKHRHTDYLLRAKYGFNEQDYVAGSYVNDKGERIEIKEKAVVDQVHRIMTWEGQCEEARAIFLNGQIVAGYDPHEGCQMYRSCLVAPIVEPVHELFSCDGSGVDSADFVYTLFNNARTVKERRGAVDRVEGCVVMLEAMNSTLIHSGGCDGYYKIHLIDGRPADPKKRHKEIHDGRSKLASEIVRCGSHGFLPWKKAYELVEALVFEDVPLLEVNDQLLKASRNMATMLDMLRGRAAWHDDLV